MAKFHYDLTGAEPIIRDVPVYDSALIDKGEFLQKELTAQYAAQFQTGGVGGATEMMDGLGISNEKLTVTHKADWGDRVSTAATTSTDAVASIANTVLTGNTYGKAIINPFAVYLTEKDQGSGSYITCVAVTAAKTMTDTVEENFDGGWIYIVPGVSGAVAANEGQLRYIAVEDSSGDDYTLLTNMTTTTAEKLIKIVPVGHAFIALDSTAMMTSDTNAHTAPDEDSLRNLESYVAGKYRPLEPLREAVHDGIQDTSLKFYNDLIIRAHMYNSMENTTSAGA